MYLGDERNQATLYACIFQFFEFWQIRGEGSNPASRVGVCPWDKLQSVDGHIIFR